MKKSVLLSTCLLLAACLTTVDLTAAVLPYFIKNAAKIYAINSQTMVDVNWAGKWRFCEKLPANWQEYPAAGIDFELKNNSVDLENVGNKTYPGLSEGAVYKKFISDRDGYAIVGIGADWWFEATCNGETFYTTFPYGNAVVPYHHTNHQFMIKVKKGETVGIIGSTGSGKSSIVSLMARFYDAKSGSVHILGAHATELIAEAALAISMEATTLEITETIHSHPTVAEAIREAVLAADSKAIHIPNRKKKG